MYVYIYKYWFYFSYVFWCFGAMCTIIGENYYAIYLKPDIVIELLNMFSTVRRAVTS